MNRLFNQYFKTLAIPKRILSDHGTHFTSNLWKQRLSELEIDVIYSSIRHSQSNSVKRVMRELGRAFRAVCTENYTSWALHVPKIELVLNSCNHFSMRCSPFELHFGKIINDNVYKLLRFPDGA